MTLDLSALRSMRKNSSGTLAKITQVLEKQEKSGGRQNDDRIWSATVDKAGNGSAIIRILPAIGEDDLPWIKMYDHGFQGPTGKWYIENCLSTLGQNDPVVEHCNTLWNGTEADKELARKRKRRLSYYANVLVIKDPGNPANEGQVKIWKFGKKIMDKLVDAMKPTFEDQEPLAFYDPFEGANFRLRIRKVEGWSNTDKSDFDSPSELCGGDEEKMLEVLNKRHDLKEFHNPKNFKSYEELAKKMNQVLFGESSGLKKAEEFSLDDEVAEVESSVKKPEPKSKPEPIQKSKVEAPPADEDDMEFFKNLLEE